MIIQLVVGLAIIYQACACGHQGVQNDIDYTYLVEDFDANLYEIVKHINLYRMDGTPGFKLQFRYGVHNLRAIYSATHFVDPQSQVFSYRNNGDLDQEERTKEYTVKYIETSSVETSKSIDVTQSFGITASVGAQFKFFSASVQSSYNYQNTKSNKETKVKSSSVEKTFTFPSKTIRVQPHSIVYMNNTFKEVVETNIYLFDLQIDGCSRQFNGVRSIDALRDEYYKSWINDQSNWYTSSEFKLKLDLDYNELERKNYNPLMPDVNCNVENQFLRNIPMKVTRTCSYGILTVLHGKI